LLSLPPLRVARLALWEKQDHAARDGLRHRTEAVMGDKSPKSKQRDVNQKNVANQQSKNQKDKRQQAQAWVPSKPKR
jgi:hypothetical protein